MKPAAPMTRPRSSLIGTRITTNDSSPNCMMSSIIGSPVRTTSRMRLLGITSSTTLPTPSAAAARFSRAAYLSDIHTMRASRSTTIAPSHMRSSPSNRLFFAIFRTSAGSLSRLTSPPPLRRGLYRPLAYSCLFHHGLVLPEQDFPFLLRSDAPGGGIDFLDARVGTGRARPRADRGEPALQVREVVDVLALAIRDDPG